MKLIKQYYITGFILLTISIVFYLVTKDLLASAFTFVPALIAFFTATVNHRRIINHQIKHQSIVQSQKNAEEFQKKMLDLDN